MAQISYKSLYEYVVREIESRTHFSTDESYKAQLERVAVAPLTDAGRYDVTVAEIVEAIMSMLAESVPAHIISGLQVTAKDPISDKVTISLGKGSVGGKLFELGSATTITIPFDSSTYIFYIVLYENGILIEKTYSSNKLTIAKIVVPQPGATSLIQDTKDTSWNAYIVNFKEYKLYGYNDKFEEDTIDLLRDNISPILADNLIGNIRLNEDLKIINTAGTLELNSDSLKLKDLDGNILSKFNRNGTYFYNTSGVELARFTNIDARIGNIIITKNSIKSDDFVTGVTGFRIQDSGDVEFNDGTFRGTLSAPLGNIGGFTITSTKLYGGIIQTNASVGVGATGVVMDTSGLRGYDAVLGLIFNLPTNGDAPTFSSGIISQTTFEINTNAVLRTASTVGDGTSNSAGILINNTGLYGCEANQLLQDANLKALINGTILLKGEIQADSGIIGSTVISSDRLTGGLIVGSTIRSPIIETSSSMPRIRIDSSGLYYQSTTAIGKYGTSGSGLSGFKYGDGTNYGAGILAYLFNTNFPILSVESSTNLADIHLYNRSTSPTSGTHRIGDLICVNGVLKLCTAGGTPGTFTTV